MSIIAHESLFSKIKSGVQRSGWIVSDASVSMPKTPWPGILRRPADGGWRVAITLTSSLGLSRSYSRWTDARKFWARAEIKIESIPGVTSKEIEIVFLGRRRLRIEINV